MTTAVNKYGLASTALTNHSEISTTLKNYYDKQVIRGEAQKSFSVFEKKEKK